MQTVNVSEVACGVNVCRVVTPVQFRAMLRSHRADACVRSRHLFPCVVDPLQHSAPSAVLEVSQRARAEGGGADHPEQHGGSRATETFMSSMLMRHYILIFLEI